jgi:prevent-host-death family protein
MGSIWLVEACAMDAVNIDDAKTRLSQLVDQAAAGQDVIVSRHGKPVARLTRLQPPRGAVRYGLLRGKLRIGDDFDAPLAVERLAGFEGR